MENRNALDHELRKLRKKLRQIETLEDIGRELTYEEKAKVSKKVEIRKEVQQLLTARAEFEVKITATSQSSATQVDCIDNVNVVSTLSNNETEMQVNEASQTEVDDVGVNSANDDENDVANVVNSGGDASYAESPLKEDNAEPNKLEEKNSTSVTSRKDRTHSERKRWRSTAWTVTQLLGHSDLVTCMDTSTDLLLTGSRDTTVKLWNVSSGNLLLNCGGHTDSVTGVSFLPSHAAIAVDSDDTPVSGPMAVSASLDCTLKIWCLRTGHCLKSTYAFNPLTCLAYFPAADGVVVGTGGGKVEVHSLITGEVVYSSLQFDDRVISVQVRGCHVYGGCVDGTVKVFQWEEQQLTGVFVTGEVRLSSGHHLSLRTVKSVLPLGDNNVVVGDDGLSIKIVDWKFNHVTKLANHTHDFGATDALWADSDVLLSSGYDIDCGVGYINVRSQPTLRYVCTLYDEGQGRVLVVKCCSINQRLVIVMGGRELRVYSPVAGDSGSDVIHARVLAEYARPVTRQSDGEEDDDVTEAMTDSQSDDDSDVTPAPIPVPPPTRSWCHVL